MGLRAGLEWCEKSRPTGIRSPDQNSRHKSKCIDPSCDVPLQYQHVCHFDTAHDKILWPTDLPCHDVCAEFRENISIRFHSIDVCN